MTVGILLAAGASTRLGRPKQWLPWGVSSLLGHAIQQLGQAGCEPIIVVLGGTARKPALEREMLSDLQGSNGNAVLLHNAAWQQGQATSLRCGLQHAANHFPADNLLIALCDQPLIPVTHYAELIHTLDDSSLIAVATRYPQGAGVPACLSPAVVGRLLTAVGDSGAKSWLRQLPPDQIKTICCDQAAFDIDTAAGYEAALSKQARSDH